jgi:hypothetical protein
MEFNETIFLITKGNSAPIHRQWPAPKMHYKTRWRHLTRKLYAKHFNLSRWHVPICDLANHTPDTELNNTELHCGRSIASTLRY